ncbi:hypothetical protein [Vibrio parahaemolyticus]|uniref:hypothetical protein n=1 Tax=Vibrio parahaemolyticus TaxID=670 RepID=UPI0004A2566E|nr:hypothetical protein [Vibrio parahaemolyticus]
MNLRRRIELKRRRREKLRAYFQKKIDQCNDNTMKKMLAHWNKMKVLKRQHANAFETGNKEVKELIVAQDFFSILERTRADKLISIAPAGDPPDILVTTDAGKQVAIEITELVNQVAIQHQVYENPDYLYELLSWNQEVFTSKVQQLIDTKIEACSSITEHYDELVLLIFTAEPRLRNRDLEKYLANAIFERLDKLDGVYILTSYDPVIKGKGLFKIGT